MEEIIQYAFSWRTEDNIGTIQLALANGTGAALEPDSPQEALLLLDVLRHEKPVFYEAQHQLIMTGLEPVGEGDEDSD